MKSRLNHRGFTLLEILLVVALIGILAGIVILAVNPAKQLAEAHNAQRRADVNTILNAVYQYAIDHNGVMPGTITGDYQEICGTPTQDCSGLLDLSALTDAEKYLTSIPRDPNTEGCNANSSCYQIKRSANDRISVYAPRAENGAAVVVTR